jgi:hypothetical protein
MRAFESRIAFSFAGTAAQVLQPASLDHQLSSADCAVPGFIMVLMWVFGEENPTPSTLVIVPGSVAITYRTHYRIFTSETTRYTNLVQAPWAKRQVEILRSGS